jgi:ABC-2 type transport system ATP-binding protein
MPSGLAGPVTAARGRAGRRPAAGSHGPGLPGKPPGVGQGAAEQELDLGVQQWPRRRVMGEPAIAVRALRKRLGTKEAVAGLDLEIAAGSCAGLVGPNGAGKTTSLSKMTGLLQPDASQVLINGLDVWADPAAAKAIIGVVPAEAQLFERLSGAELLEYAGRLRGLPVAQARSRALQLLAVLDLTADARRLVADYSTGMRKKAMLGCALIHNPSVLFLDEPLEGVDPVSADVIRRLLARFAGSGSTVLFSSHVMELVEQVCDHVSIIEQGGSWPPAPPTRYGAARPCSRRSSTWSARGQPAGRACRGSALRPAEAALADELATFVPAGQGLLHHQHELCRARRHRHFRDPGRAPERAGRPERRCVHSLRVRLADPAAPHLRPRRHPGSRRARMPVLLLCAAGYGTALA